MLEQVVSNHMSKYELILRKVMRYPVEQQYI